MVIEFFQPRKKWYQQIPADLLLLLAAITNGLLWFFWLAKLQSDQLIIYAPVAFENPRSYAYLVPGIALFLLALNFVLYLAAYKRLRALSYIFLSTALLSQIMFLLVTFYYLMSY